VVIHQADFEGECNLWRELDQARQDALAAKDALIGVLRDQLNRQAPESR
jgi:hypothetical protein